MISLQLNKGEVQLRPPLGGAIQEALIKAGEKGGINEARILIELLPHCIHTHPFGPTPIRTALAQMDGADYIKLLNGAKELLEPLMKPEETKKNSEEPSE